MTKEELEQKAEEIYTKTDAESKAIETCPYSLDMPTYVQGFVNGAEFGYNKAKEEMQAQKYSMSYENGIFKCKYKSGKEFESVDGKAWKEVLLLKESE